MSEHEPSPQDPTPGPPEGTSEPAAAAEEQTAAQPVVPPTVPAEAGAPAAPARRRWRDRVFGIRGVAAVALAGLVLGGSAGVGIGFLLDDEGHGRDGRFRGPGLYSPDRDFQMLPPGVPPQWQGELPPGLPPSQEDDQDGSGSSQSG